MSNSSSLLVCVNCCDGSPVSCVRVEYEGVVSDVIQRVCYVRALYHVDCFAVEAFAGTNQLERATKINKVLKSGCGSEQKPLKLKFHNGTILGGCNIISSLLPVCSIPIVNPTYVVKETVSHKDS